MFTFNKKLCTGCGACIVACMAAHTPEPFGEAVQYRRLNRLEGEQDGRPYVQYEVISCRHCASPACVDTCPVEAMEKGEDGFVRVDRSVCLGCGACASACPFGAIQMKRYGPEKCPGCEEKYCVKACPWGVIQWK